MLESRALEGLLVEILHFIDKGMNTGGSYIIYAAQDRMKMGTPGSENRKSTVRSPKITFL